MPRFLLCFVLMLGLFAPVFGQDAASLEGQEAPELRATSWLNAEAPLTLEGLRGQVVVLYFWGVW